MVKAYLTCALANICIGSYVTDGRYIYKVTRIDEQKADQDYINKMINSTHNYHRTKYKNIQLGDIIGRQIYGNLLYDKYMKRFNKEYGERAISEFNIQVFTPEYITTRFTDLKTQLETLLEIYKDPPTTNPVQIAAEFI